MAGLNYSNFNWSSQPYVNPEPKLGLAAGGYLALDLEPKLQLRAELWYSDKGGGATYSELAADSVTGLNAIRDYRTEARLSYLEVPLFLNIMLSSGENQLGSISLGPYFGWLLGGEMKTDMDVSTLNEHLYSASYTLGLGDLRRADVGLAAGLTAYSYNFDFNLRYSIGLEPAYKREFQDINRFVEPLNRVWTISVGYQIR